MFVIVPAFNEATRLGAVLSRLCALGYEVVCVDDGSTDDTWAVATRHSVHALRHLVNLGQGAALQTGTTYALRLGARYIVHFDADGQHSPRDVAPCIERLRRGEADVVLGSRFLEPAHRRAVPFARRLVLRGGVAVNFLTAGVWLSDAHNGLRALTREAAETIRITQNRHAHASEILDEIRHHCLRLVEQPVAVSYSRDSLQKGQSGWNAVNVLVDVLTGRFMR